MSEASAVTKLRLRVHEAFLEGASCARRWSSADATGVRALSSLSNLLSRLDVLVAASGGIGGVSPWHFGGNGDSAAAAPDLLRATQLGPLSAFWGISPRLALAHADEAERSRALLCGGVLDALREEDAGLTSAALLAAASIAKAQPGVRQAADTITLDNPIAVSEVVDKLEKLSQAVAMRTGRRMLAAMEVNADVSIGRFVGQMHDDQSGKKSLEADHNSDEDDGNEGGAILRASERVRALAQLWAADALECDNAGAVADFSLALWKINDQPLFNMKRGGGGGEDDGVL